MSVIKSYVWSAGPRSPQQRARPTPVSSRLRVSWSALGFKTSTPMIFSGYPRFLNRLMAYDVETYSCEIRQTQEIALISLTFESLYSGLFNLVDFGRYDLDPSCGTSHATIHPNYFIYDYLAGTQLPNTIRNKAPTGRNIKNLDTTHYDLQSPHLAAANIVQCQKYYQVYLKNRAQYSHLPDHLRSHPAFAMLCFVCQDGFRGAYIAAHYGGNYKSNFLKIGG